MGCEACEHLTYAIDNNEEMNYMNDIIQENQEKTITNTTNGASR